MPVEWFRWITAGDASHLFNVSAGAWIDPLTAVMLCVVCGIGFLIMVFAAGYMKGEAGYWRFFAYLGLFIFAMTCLVMGDNLIMLYVGWEGVGLCSYLLIGYYYDKPAAREAAKKAFIVNRIGDFGFAIGIMLVWYCFGTVSYFGEDGKSGFLNLAASGFANPGTSQYVYWIPFALMLGAFGKSAQFPLHVWLPDAMEGPTPVSALIHAATMVTAGVYMIVRLGALFVGNDAAMMTIAIVGAFTAIMAGSIALRQYDLKKVFAYSTVSQLGFMFVAVGVLAPVAGVFHLVTHAFFKALLFLSSGVIMHAMLGHLDLRKMSGIKTQLPITRIVFLVGCAALAGFPLLSGFWSKDEIIHASMSAGHGAHPVLSWLLWGVLTFTALMTAYYTFRVYFRVFEGPVVIPSRPPAENVSDVEHAAVHGQEHQAHGHAHDSHGHDAHHGSHEPMLMILPLLVLAVGALFAGVINLPFNLGFEKHSLGHFLGQSPSLSLAYDVASRGVSGEELSTMQLHFGQPVAEHHGMSIVPLLIGGLVAIAGISLSYLNHLADRSRGERMAENARPLTTLLEKKYLIDPLYSIAVIAPLRGLGKALSILDIIVATLTKLIGGIQVVSGSIMSHYTQRGYLQGYAVTGVVGVALILLVVFVL
jgi:NADH-quinone oxidoreductase subunit L